jgi:hypothetical protein
LAKLWLTKRLRATIKSFPAGNVSRLQQLFDEDYTYFSYMSFCQEPLGRQTFCQQSMTKDPSNQSTVGYMGHKLCQLSIMLAKCQLAIFFTKRIRATIKTFLLAKFPCLNNYLLKIIHILVICLFGHLVDKHFVSKA